VLLRIEDVTKEVNAGVKAQPGTPEANRERLATKAGIEKECGAKTGNRCEVVTLYAGAIYSLYEYKKYTDVRLVFAPEEALAFFGGDPDKLHVSALRSGHRLHAGLRKRAAGRDAALSKVEPGGRAGGRAGAGLGKPRVHGPVHHVRGTGVSTGHRIPAGAELRAVGDPDAQGFRRGERGEQAGFAGQVVRRGEHLQGAGVGVQGLESARLFAEKKAREEKLRAAIAGNAKLRQEVGDAWEAIAAAYRKWAPVQKEYYALEGGPRYSDLFRIARNVLRLPVEKAKPNGQRLKEYTDAALPSLELRMYSPAPIADGVEIAVLANYLRFLEEQLGPANGR